AEDVQAQHMKRYLQKLPAKPQADAADALGVAICHANTNKTLVALAGKASSARKGRYR
ncbi:crossover junction endodeoxyribonuclease RuvC, partial [Vibrio cholerae]|uniref:crossover junction endodeoxyribonuclease RuvC n=1 Tax=Vibrio cholerae TaxID=666 RepID=UPI0018F095CF